MTQGVTSRGAALELARRAIAAVDAGVLTAAAAGELLAPWGMRPITILGAGKGAVPMAAAVAAIAGDAIAGGLVVTKDGHRAGGDNLPGSIEIREAGHPLPDARSRAAGEELLARVRAAPPEGTVVLVVSGGASALAAVPAWGLSLDDKVAATRALGAAGADIFTLNAVRKHLSRIKGGRLLAEAASPVVALALSDVLGDDLATIGGGLSAADPTTFADALAGADRLGAALPDRVRAALDAGARGELDETPKPGDPRLARAIAHVVAGPDRLVDEAARAATALGWSVARAERRWAGDVGALADQLVEGARALVAAGAPAAAWIVGGEPTVRLPPAPGRGGRAQQVALLCARGLRALPESVDVAVLALASDGTDGPTPDAGGLVDPGTWARMEAAGVDVDRALRACDAGPALAAAGDLVSTGPTGTNLCDLYAVLFAARPLTTRAG